MPGKVEKIKVNKTTLRLEKGDITDIKIDSFVYYAVSDLALGSGFGTAISMRGGPSIQEELKKLAPLNVTEAVVSSAGDMKADFIIHAVGPKFQEADIENKLQTTILNSLKRADEKGIKAVAFPPMGANFYGVPLETSAKITLTTIADYLKSETGLTEIVVCLMDNREYTPFKNQLSNMQQA